jgi:hypothetical protein
MTKSQAMNEPLALWFFTLLASFLSVSARLVTAFSGTCSAQELRPQVDCLQVRMFQDVPQSHHYIPESFHRIPLGFRFIPDHSG